MNSSLSDIKRRLASVRQTRQITGAMETVSVAKMRKATEKLDKNRTYSAMLNRVMLEIAASGVEVNEMFSSPKSGKKLVVVLSSDRGLCGGFDHDIFKCADGLIDDDTAIIPIGRIACDYYRSRESCDLRFASSNITEYENAREIADKLIDMYGNGIREITIVYSDLIGHATVQPKAQRLLPLDKPNKQDVEEQKTSNLDSFEPSVQEVLNTLRPLYVAGAVYGAIIANNAAEHYARRTMMSAATKSADEIISKLTVEYNRSRQAVITEQIVEISGSTEALKKNEKRS